MPCIINRPIISLSSLRVKCGDGHLGGGVNCVLQVSILESSRGAVFGEKSYIAGGSYITYT